jgi:hypothetical protein
MPDERAGCGQGLPLAQQHQPPISCSPRAAGGWLFAPAWNFFPPRAQSERDLASAHRLACAAPGPEGAHACLEPALGRRASSGLVTDPDFEVGDQFSPSGSLGRNELAKLLGSGANDLSQKRGHSLDQNRVLANGFDGRRRSLGACRCVPNAREGQRRESRYRVGDWREIGCQRSARKGAMLRCGVKRSRRWSAVAISASAR